MKNTIVIVLLLYSNSTLIRYIAKQVKLAFLAVSVPSRRCSSLHQVGNAYQSEFRVEIISEQLIYGHGKPLEKPVKPLDALHELQARGTEASPTDLQGIVTKVVVAQHPR